MRHVTIAAATMLALMGCKADYTGEGSIQAALLAANGQPASMTGVIGIEAGSESSCRTDAPAMAEALAKPYPGATFLGCTDRSFTTYAEFRVALPVALMKAGDKSAVPLSVAVEPQDGKILVGLYLDQGSVDRLAASLPGNVTALFDGRFDATVTVDVRNDTTTPQSVSTNGAFVDGKPAVFLTRHDLTVGQTIRVQPSDVQRAALSIGTGAFLFAVDLPE